MKLTPWKIETREKIAKRLARAVEETTCVDVSSRVHREGRGKGTEYRAGCSWDAEQRILINTPQGPVSITLTVSADSAWLFARFHTDGPLSDNQKEAARAVGGNVYSGKLNCYLGGLSTTTQTMVDVLQTHLRTILRKHTAAPRDYVSPYLKARKVASFEYKGETFEVFRTRLNGKRMRHGWTVCHGVDRVPMFSSREGDIYHDRDGRWAAVCMRFRLHKGYKLQPPALLIHAINRVRDDKRAVRIPI